ncbi:phosphotransferase family protein [Labedaea rhizosphaerae]|uniref:Aminoglycoside phosphotransferase (APT) family kinase protein n=1 Tax=Labedaea rhizosphaerae TaxID=598644 RepID=A0A4R6SHX6_LABRH|nr:phosphotransferase family protein [Labedaea rhizosphaerae]TDQ01425.1 aminoglycoside phosphotransferase (APT) family kinase protein [Labedaea rhizosphaerae]
MIGELVRPAELGRLLAAATGEPRWRELSASLISGGKSNLTFELTSPAGALVLRRPPTGDLPSGAHDMGREVAVQRALAPTAVPVARIVLWHPEPEPLGVPFYVMEKVAGHVIRGELPPSYADTPAQRVAMSDALVDVLVGLHALDPVAVGLGDLGRPAGFMARQVDRWGKRGRAPSITALGAALAERIPQSPPPSVIHGDLRLDNCITDPDDPGRIAAVLDWELATVGDPLTDLGLLLFYWREPGEPQSDLVPTVTALPGFPGREHLVERYATRSGRDPGDIAFYRAFAHLKFAVIAEGIAARVASGAMAGQDFGALDGEAVRIAEAGLDLLRKG